MRSLARAAAGSLLCAAPILAAVPETVPGSRGPDPSLSLLADAAEAALDAGKHEEALALAQRILATDGGEPDALEVAGVASAALGAHADAERSLARACSLRPERSKCFVRLGRARALRADEAERLGDLDLAAALRDAALESIERAVALDPESSSPRAAVASVLLDAERFEEAIPAHEAWIERAPSDRAPYLSLVDAYAGASRWDDAASVHERLSNGEDAGAVGLRALDRLVDAGRLEEAEALVRRLAKLEGPRARTFGLEAVIVAIDRSYYAGLDRLTRYLGLNPPPEEAAAIANAVLARSPKVRHRKVEPTRVLPVDAAGVDEPALRVRVEPYYPVALRRSGVEGTAILRIVVRADGSVGRVEVVDSTHPAFSVAAMDAVTQWRYAPAIRMGEAVDATREVRVEFRVDGTRGEP